MMIPTSLFTSQSFTVSKNVVSCPSDLRSDQHAGAPANARLKRANIVNTYKHTLTLHSASTVDNQNVFANDRLQQAKYQVTDPPLSQTSPHLSVSITSAFPLFRLSRSL